MDGVEIKKKYTNSIKYNGNYFGKQIKNPIYTSIQVAIKYLT